MGLAQHIITQGLEEELLKPLVAKAQAVFEGQSREEGTLAVQTVYEALDRLPVVLETADTTSFVEHPGRWDEGHTGKSLTPQEVGTLVARYLTHNQKRARINLGRVQPTNVNHLVESSLRDRLLQAQQDGTLPSIDGGVVDFGDTQLAVVGRSLVDNNGEKFTAYKVMDVGPASTEGFYFKGRFDVNTLRTVPVEVMPLEQILQFGVEGAMRTRYGGLHGHNKALIEAGDHHFASVGDRVVEAASVNTSWFTTPTNLRTYIPGAQEKTHDITDIDSSRFVWRRDVDTAVRVYLGDEEIGGWDPRELSSTITAIRERSVKMYDLSSLDQGLRIDLTQAIQGEENTVGGSTFNLTKAGNSVLDRNMYIPEMELGRWYVAKDHEAWQIALTAGENTPFAMHARPNYEILQNGFSSRNVDATAWSLARSQNPTPNSVVRVEASEGTYSFLSFEEQGKQKLVALAQEVDTDFTRPRVFVSDPTQYTVDDLAAMKPYQNGGRQDGSTDVADRMDYLESLLDIPQGQVAHVTHNQKDITFYRAHNGDLIEVNYEGAKKMRSTPPPVPAQDTDVEPLLEAPDPEGEHDVGEYDAAGAKPVPRAVGRVRRTVTLTSSYLGDLESEVSVSSTYIVHQPVKVLEDEGARMRTAVTRLGAPDASEQKDVATYLVQGSLVDTDVKIGSVITTTTGKELYVTREGLRKFDNSIPLPEGHAGLVHLMPSLTPQDTTLDDVIAAGHQDREVVYAVGGELVKKGTPQVFDSLTPGTLLFKYESTGDGIENVVLYEGENEAGTGQSRAIARIPSRDVVAAMQKTPTHARVYVTNIDKARQIVDESVENVLNDQPEYRRNHMGVGANLNIRGAISTKRTVGLALYSPTEHKGVISPYSFYFLRIGNSVVEVSNLEGVILRGQDVEQHPIAQQPSESRALQALAAARSYIADSRFGQAVASAWANKGTLIARYLSHREAKAAQQTTAEPSRVGSALRHPRQSMANGLEALSNSDNEYVAEVAKFLNKPVGEANDQYNPLSKARRPATKQAVTDSLSTLGERFSHARERVGDAWKNKGRLNPALISRGRAYLAQRRAAKEQAQAEPQQEPSVPYKQRLVERWNALSDGGKVGVAAGIGAVGFASVVGITYLLMSGGESDVTPPVQPVVVASAGQDGSTGYNSDAAVDAMILGGAVTPDAGALDSEPRDMYRDAGRAKPDATPLYDMSVPDAARPDVAPPREVSFYQALKNNDVAGIQDRTSEAIAALCPPAKGGTYLPNGQNRTDGKSLYCETFNDGVSGVGVGPAQDCDQALDLLGIAVDGFYSGKGLSAQNTSRFRKANADACSNFTSGFYTFTPENN